MSVEQRLEIVESDLELVKQLLTSAASYGESAQRRLDTLGQRVDEFVFQAQRQLTAQAEKTERLEGAFERLEAIAAHLTRKQDTQDQTLQTLTQIAVDQATLLQRQDEQLAELRRIGSNHEADLAELRAAVERLDRLMDYLLRRDQGNQAQ